MKVYFFAFKAKKYTFKVQKYTPTKAYVQSTKVYFAQGKVRLTLEGLARQKCLARVLGKSARQESENMENVWQKCLAKVPGVKRKGTECNGVERSAKEWNGVQRNAMEWNGVQGPKKPKKKTNKLYFWKKG